MNTLYFENPEFKEGTNLTVRRGIKWAMEKEADVQGLGEKKLTARVFVFEDIPEADLINEHDPNCRSLYGLLEVMKGIYPGFSPREIVTLVEFEV